jgi:AcrR family transcriptional regulator
MSSAMALGSRVEDQQTDAGGAAAHQIDPMPPKNRRSGNRKQELLDAAAKRFCRDGYENASTRDIADDVGILSGSIYYHFKSKEHLLVAVHEEGVRRISHEVLQAIGSLTDPWKRLEAACAAYLETLLDGSDYAQVVIRELPRGENSARTQLIVLRDQYEAIFTNLINKLTLRSSIDRRHMRLFLLGALNSTQGWYSRGPDGQGDTPADIARSFVALLRAPISLEDQI